MNENSIQDSVIRDEPVGATHVQLPYKEIRHLLRDDSPISSLID